MQLHVFLINYKRMMIGDYRFVRLQCNWKQIKVGAYTTNISQNNDNNNLQYI